MSTTLRDAAALPLGEVVSWKSPKEVAFSRLKDALKNSGLDENLARDMLPRNAFRRAIKELDDDRIIRQVNEDADKVYFQFTRESKVGDKFDYSYETMLSVAKSTGAVDCEDGSRPELVALAQNFVDEKMETRSASDVTRILQKVFTSRGDLFHIRESGGVYFVPQEHADLVDKAERMMDEIGGYIRSFRVTADGGRTTKSVKESVREGMDKLVGDLRAAVESFSFEESSDRKLENTLERLRIAKLKVAGYGDLLDEYKAELQKAADDAEHMLKRKAGLIADDEAEASEAASGTADESAFGDSTASADPELDEALAAFGLV